MEKTKDEILSRIARLLMLHSSFSANLGLLNGKMGIALFFYHLSRYTGRKIYDDFAGELIDEIYAEIHDHYPANFKDGLCGVAWGIEYLIQNHFVEADANEVLVDLDKMAFEWDVRKISDPTLDNGLEGIAHSVISRCTGKPASSVIIPKEYISELKVALRKNKQEELSAMLERVQAGESFAVKDNLLMELVRRVKFKQKNLFNDKRPLGIDHNGYAGIGLNLMLIRK
jgi:hypothetical protein